MLRFPALDRSVAGRARIVLHRARVLSPPLRHRAVIVEGKPSAIHAFQDLVQPLPVSDQLLLLPQQLLLELVRLLNHELRFGEPADLGRLQLIDWLGNRRDCFDTLHVEVEIAAGAFIVNLNDIR